MALFLKNKARKKRFSEFTFNPTKPVLTLCGRNLNFKSGSCDLRKIEKRKDVLVFSTLPLKKPVNVTGKVKVILYVSSSAVDTDFTAFLSDVYPDSKSMLIAEGIVRCKV